MKDQLVVTKNIANLRQFMLTMNKRAPGAPGIGILDGLPGAGKTHGAMWAMASQDGVFARMLGISSPASVLESFCRELDIQPRGSNAKTLDAVVAKLNAEKRPIMLDEADKIVSNTRVIELVRDIHDMAQVPIALIGEGSLQRKVNAIPRLSSRVIDVCEFRGLDAGDARLVAKTLCEVDVADDLLGDINRAAGGLIRLLVIALYKAEGVARAEDITKLSLKDWPDGVPYFVGHTPTRQTRSR